MLFVGVAAIASDEANYHVAVLLSADDTIENVLRSCINREIRNLGDVSIVENDAQFSLRVVAMRNTVGGQTVGYIASMAILDHFEARILAFEKEQELGRVSAEDRNRKDDWPSPDTIRRLGHVSSHIVHSSPDLTGLCQSVVANLDVEAIENLRRDTAMWVDAADKVLKKKSN